LEWPSPKGQRTLRHTELKRNQQKYLPFLFLNSFAIESSIQICEVMVEKVIFKAFSTSKNLRPEVHYLDIQM
jgi:hypothetical protein